MDRLTALTALFWLPSPPALIGLVSFMGEYAVAVKRVYGLLKNLFWFQNRASIKKFLEKNSEFWL